MDVCQVALELLEMLLESRLQPDLFSCFGAERNGIDGARFIPRESNPLEREGLRAKMMVQSSG